MTTMTNELTRDSAIARIKAALGKRSDKPWSVTGGRGTARGWITVDAPPRRRTWHFVEVAGEFDETGMPKYEEVDDLARGPGHMGPADRAELGRLLGLDQVHYQGVSIPAGLDYYREYIDRAEGRAPTVRGERYWD